MNILHVKYAIEVAKTRSINRAAENLHMGQPNLSRAIKELEDSIGITIFKRTTKGILITTQGEEFLKSAENIVAQLDKFEANYRPEKDENQKFSISVPRASYIADAFTEFCKSLDRSKPLELYYRETNAMRAIDTILHCDYKLAIIRYQTVHEKYFKLTLYEKALCAKTVAEFYPQILCSKEHPLANKDRINDSELAGHIEIAYADPFVPSLSVLDLKKEEFSSFVDNRILIFERASQFELLRNMPNTFSRTSPVPKSYLDNMGLVQIPCVEKPKKYKDVLIYKRGYSFNEYDLRFIEELDKSKAACFRLL